MLKFRLSWVVKASTFRKSDCSGLHRRKKMKRAIFLIVFTVTTIFPGGIMLLNPATGSTMRIQNIQSNIMIENQVSISKVTTEYRNNTTLYAKPTLIFTLPDNGSATRLRWQLRGIWYEAGFSANPQDTSIGGGGTVHPYVADLLKSPCVVYPFQDSIGVDSTITVELTYVEFLKYDMGYVNFKIPVGLSSFFGHSQIANDFIIRLVSTRQVDSLFCTSHPNAAITIGADTSLITGSELIGLPVDIKGGYLLASDQLGLSSFSTYLSDSASVADTINGGYFLFVVEPARDTTLVLKKKITLVIDRSGSMSGNKIVQAKNAALFIVDRLNEIDLFNIVSFSTAVTSFMPSHVPVTGENLNLARNWINTIVATGLTNISGAFATTVEDFVGATDSTANIILFLTDGQATTGITGTPELLAYINQLTAPITSNLSVFTFGVGTDVDVSLLQSIANQHSGLATFLMNDQLEPVITKFYLKIQNPILISPVVAFSSQNIVDVHPDDLPNLYIGEQLLVSGRYPTQVSGPVTVTLTGTVYGQPVSYQYPLALSDTAMVNYQFLPKVWAKAFIDDLLAQYYTFPPNSPQALEIKGQIIALSVKYGVITIFTSFGNPTGIEEESETTETLPADFTLYQNYPNPFNPSTTIKFALPRSAWVKITVYDLMGRIVDVLVEEEKEAGIYTVIWNASQYASGTYIVEMNCDGKQSSRKILLIK